jgi:predicted ribosomally synthesized peptide with SipW-like signal peptide
MAQNKRFVCTFCIGIFAIGLLVAGATLAYFTSTDEVTNRTEARDVSINLYEPKWYTEGSKLAAQQVPGEEIPKDPQVINTSEQPVYVRMKITLKGSDGKEITDNNLAAKIKNAIYVGNVTLWDNDGACANENFLYSGGWFYYVDSVSQNVKTLSPNEKTPALFSKLVIPVKKSDYNGVFDTDYTIDVEAQAVAKSAVSDTSIEKISAVFDGKYGDG